MKKPPPQKLVYDPESFRGPPPGVSPSPERRKCVSCIPTKCRVLSTISVLLRIALTGLQLEGRSWQQPDRMSVKHNVMRCRLVAGHCC